MQESFENPKSLPMWLKITLVVGSFVVAVLEAIRAVSQPDFFTALAAFVLFANGVVWLWRFRVPDSEATGSEKEKIAESHR